MIKERMYLMAATAVIAIMVTSGVSEAVADDVQAVFAPIAEVSGASLEPVVDTDEVFPAAYVEDFTVDGDLEKAVWKKATPISPLLLRKTKKPMSYRSDIRILYSKKAIYIGATLWQDMSQMVCKWDQRDAALWNDDNLEMFLHIPGEGGNHLYQYLINPIGAFTDLRDGNRNYYTRGAKHATRRFPDRWTAEIKLPFDGIPMDRPVAGDSIGMRVDRTVHAPDHSAGSLPMLLTSGNTQRARFAKLLFSEPSGADAAKFAAEGAAHRQETLRKRFYSRFASCKAQFEDIRGGAASFARSKHPLHMKAWAGIRQMEMALAAFETRFAAVLAAEKAIPKKDCDEILAQFAGFKAYASKYAYVVWQGDPWRRGSPADLPPDDARTMPERMVFEQAGNEREAVGLNIAGLLCGSRLDLRLHPQSVEKSKKTPFISTDRFEIYSEPFVRFSGATITAPLVRSAGNVVTVSPGRTVRVWVVFNSRGVPAGDHATRLAFKSAYEQSVADRELPVAIKVWKFTLPETRDWPIKSFFWGPFSFAEDEVALLELTHACHVTHAWTQQHRYRYGLYGDRGFYKKPNRGMGEIDPNHDFEDEFALRGNEAFLRRAKELGMRFVIGWGTPKSLDWFKVTSKRFLDMGFKYEDFVYKSLIKDEFVRKDIPAHAVRREEVWNWNTNLYFQAVYLSTPPPTGATMDDIEAAKLPEFYKMWTVIHGRCRDPEKGPDTIRRLRQKGCQVWSYKCGQFMQGHATLKYYRFYPWEAYMMGLDGFAFWTVYGPRGDDGWDSRDGYDEGLCWRGLDKKPIPTKKLEAVREGLEDVAYMAILEKELARQKAKGKGFPQYEALLAERAGIMKADDQKRVDAWRLAVGRAIDSLSK